MNCNCNEAWPGKRFYDQVYNQMPDSMKLSLGPFGPEKLDNWNRDAYYNYITPRYRLPFALNPWVGQTGWAFQLSPYLWHYW